MSTLMQNAAERILNPVDSSENEFTNDLKSFEEIANEAQGLTVTPSGTLVDSNKAKSIPEYLKTQAQIGLTEGNAILGALGETAYETLSPTGDVNIGEIVQNSLFGKQGEYSVNNPNARSMKEIPQYFGQAIDRWSNNSERAFVNTANKILSQGVTDYQVTLPNKNLRTNSSFIESLGSGVRLASDPITLLGAPFKAGPLVTRLASETVLGTEIDLAGKAGKRIEEVVVGSDTEIGKVLGQSAALVAGSYKQGAVEKIIGGTGNVIKKKGGKILNTLLNRPVFGADGATNQASGAAQKLLRLTTEGTDVNQLDKIVSEFNLLAERVDRKSFPILIALGDSPFIKEEATRLAKNDPNFRAQVSTELKRLRQEIEENATNIFGTRYAKIAPLEELSESTLNKLEAVRRTRIEVDKKIHDAATNPNPSLTAEEQGQVVTNLIASREKLARLEMAPHYKSLMSEATANKITLPREGTEQLFNFVRDNNIRNLFGIGTRVEKQVLSYLKPKIKQVETIDFTTGTKKTTEKKVFPELSFEQVDSLKRAINQVKRGPLSQEQRRQLFQLEEVFTDVRELIPGGFSQKLQDLDLLYWEKVGVPFGEQGIKDLTSKKYSEEVIPVLLKNNKVVDDFIGATGSRGIPIVRDAILTDMYKTVFKTGEFNAKAYKQWLRKRREQIKHVPGLGEQVNTIRFDADNLYKEIDRLDSLEASIQSELSNNYFKGQKGTNSFGSKYYAEGFSEPRYMQLVKDITTDQQKAAQFFNSLDGLDSTTKEAVLGSTRREMLEYTKTRGGVPFLLDPENKEILDKLMGKSYQNDLIELTKLTQAMEQADVARLAFNAANKINSKIKLGSGEVDVTYVGSQIKDRITSAPMQVLRLGTKWYESVVKGATDESIKKLLLSPDGLAELAKLNKERKGGEFKRNHLEEFIKITQKYRLIGAYDITKQQLNNEE